MNSRIGLKYIPFQKLLRKGVLNHSMSLAKVIKLTACIEHQAAVNGSQIINKKAKKSDKRT